jgi:hypothetical protein
MERSASAISEGLASFRQPPCRAVTDTGIAGAKVRVRVDSWVWHQFCHASCLAMDAFTMIAQCASHQSAGDAPLRYELHTSLDDTCAARFADLESALDMGKLLVGLGYKTVFVRDELATSGQPELWVWEERRPGRGRWRAQPKGRGGALLGRRSLKP